MNKHILIVDDEENLRIALECLLRQNGYQVSMAEDGEAALQALDTARPDLVLLDVIMPKRNGFEVCEMVRARPEWQALKIVFLTAKAREIERTKGLALGANAYITKPFAAQELLQELEALLL